ncbi:MAG: prolyl oligopeptidase family serine peptidase [Actinobacteria bacterium]|nr:prolyl oligopeptidase family serine peptidase [Actinomycetota bacterium]MBU1942782.1 prolyl oligopeptidase family serine peptidase [Actinomycetota bacterium]MBU2686104.1 prolyl oligopeptidase family serine peptidase [Actinomycetota bacterium]
MRQLRSTVGAVLVFLLAFLLVSTLTAGCRRSGSGDEADLVDSIRSGGRERTYVLHVPPGYDEGAGNSLVLAFHGHGGQGENQERLSGMEAVSDANGFLIAYPDGIDRGWNDGRGINEGIDDVGFARDLVEKLSAEYGVDPKRVYATGISNGGFMSFRLACDAPDVFAAVAPVAALMSVPLVESNRSTTPVSLLLMNGTGDPLVPWEGGQIGGALGDRGEGISTQASIEYWVALDGCATTPQAARLPDMDPGDGTTVTQYVYPGGRDSTEVVLCEVTGGGHTWPGGYQYMRESIIGRTSRDLEASEYIWEFFRDHPRD